ncbi:HpcH/HpaI aldolase/citrate lyase family protein [Roseomonas xinghualingensis]|uniref:HpcH/HpaI aldolase/citrate lyase family protein n=1 Tax=Roseomonas xinghualingensis TaxID=2986475 RepID=UPI0021F1481E|nr:CoA ester lyase [Roseomonas sp. SXEYE001]MCV4210119.1 CoA ester lyase [Roseomonas sp. SXEYE001]
MTPRPDLPLWRSLLFVPATAERFVAKAHLRGADAIILDLEDAVAPAEKDAARHALRAAVPAVARGGADVCVRINRPLDLAVPDIASAVAPGVTALVVPKAMGAEHLTLLSEVIAAHETAAGLAVGTVKLVALVEEAEALPRMAEIARAPRMVAMAVGGEDLATDLDAEPTADSLYVAKMMGIHAARAAGILPMGSLGSVAGIGDTPEYRAVLRRSRALGFACATCVHPAQVAAINEEYGPRPEALDHARRLVAAFEAGVARGLGAIEFEGAMVDLPVAERARRLIARAPLSSRAAS